MTLKSGLEVTEGHSNWYHSKALVQFLLPFIVRYLVSFARYSDLLVENQDIFILQLYLALLQGATPSEFQKDV